MKTGFVQQGLIPRLMSEIAKSRTGVEIHPLATIASPFFIDHGTMVVIGETAIIGSHCVFYAGVTMGAVRVNRNMAGDKRHPTLGHGTIVYSNASVLGDQTIGDNCIIGANCRVITDIPPNHIVKIDEEGVQVVVPIKDHRANAKE